MAELDVEAQLSVGEASLQALAGIRASLDTVAARLQRVLDAQARYEREGPVRVAFRGAVTSDANGDTAVIDLGGPPYGRLWEVRRLVVGGSLWSSSVTGTALIVVGATGSALPSTADVVDSSSSLPASSFFSAGQLVLRNPQHLYLVITAPSASSTYVAGGEGFSVPDQPGRAVPLI